jgi:ribosomal protein S18 acetylase RimI-like enzyme
MDFNYKWTDGNDEVFRQFYIITEDYYSSLVGGKENRKSFIPYNLSSSIENVLLVYCNDKPVACSGLKRYSNTDVEIKRVWVEPDYRGNHIAKNMMQYLEEKAKQLGFSRMILQTREIMSDAVKLYTSLNYYRINNYPPYDELNGALCLAKDI